MNHIEENAGVYILQTKNEYRVAYSKKIDEIYGPFSDETGRWMPNNTKILEIFGESPVFDNRAAAEDYAQDIIKLTGETEYGISVVPLSPHLNWDSIAENA